MTYPQPDHIMTFAEWQQECKRMELYCVYSRPLRPANDVLLEHAAAQARYRNVAREAILNMVYGFGWGLVFAAIVGLFYVMEWLQVRS